MALRLERDVELVHEREPGERELQPRRFVEHDRHVLHEVVDEEPGREVTRDDARAPGSRAPSSPPHHSDIDASTDSTSSPARVA